MTTLRDIISQDTDALWRDNAGEVWDGEAIREQWGEDLDREASYDGRQICYLDERGYVLGAEAVLTNAAEHEIDLATRRRALGLSQAQLGSWLDVAAGTIARWERGEMRVQHPAMLDLALRQIGDERKKI